MLDPIVYVKYSTFSYIPGKLPVLKKLDNRGGRPIALSTHFHFVLNGTRFVYCRIRKNGCSAMQRLIIQSSPHKQEASESEYGFLQRRHGIRRMKVVRLADRRILIVRDPIERIRSLYTNKFVQRIGNSDIFRNYFSVTGEDPRNSTFRDFVRNYVSQLGDVRLDPHVWPQSWHLCPVLYDHVIELSELFEGMSQVIGTDLAREFFCEKVNSSPETDLVTDDETYARLASIYAEDMRLIERTK